MTSGVRIKRSPIVVIRTFAAIEILAFIAYSIAVALGNYKYELYTQLSLSSILPYPFAKILFLSGIQFAITMYAFFYWYYDEYVIQPGMLSHRSGVFFKKTTTMRLPVSAAITMHAGPLGKLLHYGSLAVKENGAAHAMLTLHDISYPRERANIVMKFAGRKQELHETMAREEHPDLTKLLREDEHEELEFKSSLRFDHKLGDLNRELEKASMKTVTAFLNSKGGRLVVGVNDKKEIMGLHHDYGTLKRQDSDGFENHFTQVFNAMVGPEFRYLVRLSFHPIDGKDVCVVDVAPSARPAYLKLNENEHFYVRTGNVSTPLTFSELESYIGLRWPRRKAQVS